MEGKEKKKKEKEKEKKKENLKKWKHRESECYGEYPEERKEARKKRHKSESLIYRTT